MFHSINQYFFQQENCKNTIKNYNKQQDSTKLVSLFRNDLLFSDELTSTWLPFWGCATEEGEFYYVNNISNIKQYALDNVLAKGIDKLEELKLISDDANPVIFYCKYK